MQLISFLSFFPLSLPLRVSHLAATAQVSSVGSLVSDAASCLSVPHLSGSHLTVS